MNHAEYMQWLQEITTGYPRFKDGRIDYSAQRHCPVVSCVIVHQNHVLLACRSARVDMYPHVWNGISGFIDKHVPLHDVIYTELQEEVGIKQHHVADLKILERMHQPDPEMDRHWHTYPVLALLHAKPPLSLNWENKHAQWVPFAQVETYDLMPGFYAVFERALREMQSTNAA